MGSGKLRSPKLVVGNEEELIFSLMAGERLRCERHDTVEEALEEIMVEYNIANPRLICGTSVVPKESEIIYLD